MWYAKNWLQEFYGEVKDWRLISLDVVHGSARLSASISANFFYKRRKVLSFFN